MSATSTTRASGLTLTTRASRAALQWRLLLLWAGLLVLWLVVSWLTVRGLRDRSILAR